MTNVTCKYVEENLDRLADGDLSDRERAELEVHLAVCDGCRESAALWAGLEVAASQAALEPLSARLEAIRARGAWAEAPAQSAPGRGRFRWPLIAVPLAAAAAMALVLALPDDPAGERRIPSRADRGPAAVAALPDPTPIDPEQALPRTDGYGRRAIEITPGCALWLGDSTVAWLDRIDDREAWLGLERGYALAEIGGVDPGFRFVVTTPHLEIEARGTVFSVEILSDGEELVRVIEGQVEIRDVASRKEALVLEARQELERGRGAPRAASHHGTAMDLAFLARGIGPAVASDEPSAAAEAPLDDAGRGSAPERRTPTPTAAAQGSDRPAGIETADILVKLAQSYRREGDYRAATRTYQRVIELYPSSTAASNCLVALGQMKLGAVDRPAEALGDFKLYLSREPDGRLAEEARIGSVRALARLGRHRDVVAAATAYLDRAPAGRSAAEMTRRRGDAHRGSGSCAQALADYRAVLARWPSSAQAAAARAGLEACQTAADR